VDFIKNKIAVHYINPGKFKSRLTPNWLFGIDEDYILMLGMVLKPV
jgi:hypothetical protein